MPTSTKVPCIVVLSKIANFGTFYDIAFSLHHKKRTGAGFMPSFNETKHTGKYQAEPGYESNQQHPNHDKNQIG